MEGREFVAYRLKLLAKLSRRMSNKRFDSVERILYLTRCKKTIRRARKLKRKILK